MDWDLLLLTAFYFVQGAGLVFIAQEGGFQLASTFTPAKECDRLKNETQISWYCQDTDQHQVLRRYNGLPASADASECNAACEADFPAKTSRVCGFVYNLQLAFEERATLTPSPSATLGVALNFSGSQNWHGERACAEYAEAHNHIAGIDLQYVQNLQGKCHFYASGISGRRRTKSSVVQPTIRSSQLVAGRRRSSGAGGVNTWRVDLKPTMLQNKARINPLIDFTDGTVRRWNGLQAGFAALVLCFFLCTDCTQPRACLFGEAGVTTAQVMHKTVKEDGVFVFLPVRRILIPATLDLARVARARVLIVCLYYSRSCGRQLVALV